jgi:hypothetical protein
MASLTVLCIPLHPAFDASDAQVTRTCAWISRVFCCSLLQQSALLLQDAGALYVMLRAASGGHAYAQFVCQRVLPSIGLLPNDIEGKQPCIVSNPSSRRTQPSLQRFFPPC